MSVRIDIAYEGRLHCSAVHDPSGARLATDAPKDNQGKGESFSPSDLLATALGTCLVTVMGIVAQQGGMDIAGTRVQVVKEMTPPPRRVGRLEVAILVPKEKAGRLSAEQRGMLEEASRECPVCRSIHPDVVIPVKFVWES